MIAKVDIIRPHPALSSFKGTFKLPLNEETRHIMIDMTLDLAPHIDPVFPVMLFKSQEFMAGKLTPMGHISFYF